MERDIGGDAHVGGRDVLCNPVVGRVCAFAHQNHTHVRGAWRPDRSRAVGDNQNIQPTRPRNDREPVCLMVATQKLGHSSEPTRRSEDAAPPRGTDGLSTHRWRRQSRANPSLETRNSLLAGKIQGNSSILASDVRISHRKY